MIKAYDGTEALELLKENTVNLMIVDVMMPGLDGIRTTRKVRETSSIPIIILSAKSEDADKILGLNLGADDYITKPFLPAELTAGTVHPDGTAEAEVVICEGRFHQVKRMFAAVGRNVLALTRLAMGPLSLPPELPEGAFRELPQEELAALRTLRGTEEQEEPADPA